MPRLVRRAPLSERIKAYLDPGDLLLWLSEELNDDAYDEWLKDWATPIGICLNILFILARGASKPGSGRGVDDVFGDIDGRSGSGWFSWFVCIHHTYVALEVARDLANAMCPQATFLVHSLTVLCCWNAFYTFFRKKHYRLFEQPVDEPPATPSAHRVRVDSSPMSSSPLRYLQSVISTATASSRAYPDAEREVWELSMWDPKPFNLTLFTLFSPGHLILYYSLLPPAALDPKPSVTVFKVFVFGVLLSLQLGYLKISFSQQSKDATLVHGEVMNEYDTKFVRPSLNRPVRDVGTQTRESTMTPRGAKTREVDIYTPTTIINRGFRTNPNPNYASQYDPHNLASQPESRRNSGVGVQRSITTPSFTTPANAYAQTNGYTQSSTFSRPSTGGGPEYSSPLISHHERLNAASTLRKTASSSQLPGRTEGVQDRRGGSPLKRMSTPGDGRSSGVDGGRRRETGRY